MIDKYQANCIECQDKLLEVNNEGILPRFRELSYPQRPSGGDIEVPAFRRLADVHVSFEDDSANLGSEDSE